MTQYLSVKEKHPDKLVLFRMGDFYEMFYDDAKTSSKILGITLTARDGKSENPTPMAGIPYHALNEYLPKLIHAGLKVAICDQVEDPSTAKGLVKREVVRVVTSGTLTEDHLLEAGKSNYLLALDQLKSDCYIAYLDLSTGEIFARCIKTSRALDMIHALRPKELLCSRLFSKSELAAELKTTLDLPTTLMDDWNFNSSFGEDKLKKVYQVQSAEGFGFQSTSSYLRPIGALLQYLEQTQMKSDLHLRKIKTLQNEENMILDRQTCRNLEIFQNQQDSTDKGTLFSCLNQTSTPMGSRRLAMWLAHPLLHRGPLQERYDQVEAFQSLQHLQEWMRSLQKLKDLERPLGRLRCGRFSARDLKSVAHSLKLVPVLNTHLEGHEVLRKKRVPELNELANKIDGSLKDELPFGLNEGGMIADGVDSELDELRKVRDGGKDILHSMQEKLKEELDLPGLKVRHNKVFGYYIEVPKAQSSRVPEHFIRKQTLVNAERYIIAELKEFEDQIFSAQDKIIALELKWIENLRQKMIEKSEDIMEIATRLAELDVLSSFAESATRLAYVRPQLVDRPELKLKNSRHPVVERLLGTGEFTANDLVLEEEKTRMILLTGPNMAGKSTFIRQVGLIQIMAQIGCFVPADEAVLGCVDRVFTRVGAGDDLSSGRSTFMVEMNETANILHNATPKSLVILDEVGRGTSTLDGLSLAWAITEELHNNPSCSALCLFATHYHELTQLALECPHLSNHQVAVEEIDKRIIFLHKIIEGGADKSYGLHVASLAGLPEKVIHRAEEKLAAFENPSLEERVPQPSTSRSDYSPLFTVEDNDSGLKSKIQQINPDEITPIQALIFLKELKDDL